jgi:VanZ family protein
MAGDGGDGDRRAASDRAVVGTRRHDVRTGTLTGQQEHVCAYAAVTLFALSVLGAGATRTAAALLIAYAGVLEIGQLWVPGRHAAFIDFSASSLGVLIGLALVTALRAWHRRHALAGL